MASNDRRGGAVRPRLFGIEFNVRYSWVIISLLLAWSLASGGLPAVYGGLPESSYWAMALIVVALLAVSILAHELAHALVGRAMGVKIERISLFMFGGAADLKQEPKTPQSELVMAAAGPLTSLGLALVFSAAAGALDAGGRHPAMGGALAYLATLNLVLAIFNSLPAFPMDGGRMLRAAIWMGTGQLARATRIAARAGEAFGLVIAAAGLAIALTGHLTGGLWWVLIGLFLRAAARGSITDLQTREILSDLLVSDLMTRRVDTVPADMTVEAFVEQRLYNTRHNVYPVLEHGRWIGVLEPRRILKTPQADWPFTRVRDVCLPAAEAASTWPGAAATEVFEQMLRAEAPHIVVTRPDGGLAGLVTLKDILGRVQIERLFSATARQRPNAALG